MDFQIHFFSYQMTPDGFHRYGLNQCAHKMACLVQEGEGIQGLSLDCSHVSPGGCCCMLKILQHKLDKITSLKNTAKTNRTKRPKELIIILTTMFHCGFETLLYHSFSCWSLHVQPFVTAASL